MDRSPTSATTLRQFKWFALVLVVSNIGIGLLSVHFLRRIDRQYSELVNRSVPAFGDLQDVTAGIINAMRATNPASSLRAAEREKYVRDDVHRRQRFLETSGQELGEPPRTELKTAGENFTRLAEQVLQKIQMASDVESSRLRDDALRAAFDRYVAATTRAGDYLETHFLKENQTVSDTTGRMSTVIVGVGTWPVVALLVLLLVVTMTVLILLVMFRGRDLGDQP